MVEIEADEGIQVTGANRGIGLAILQNLATDSRATKIERPTTYLLGTRSLQAGHEAISNLTANHPEITKNTQVTIVPIELDLSSDTSLISAVTKISDEYGHLDVLIHNAGVAVIPPPFPSTGPSTDPAAEDEATKACGAIREAFATTYDTNVTAIFILTNLLLPLLRRSTHSSTALLIEGTKHKRRGGLVITVSSHRASLSLLTSPEALPPTRSVPYSVSKTAVNALSIHMAQLEIAHHQNLLASDKMEADTGVVQFELISPGHCRTAFNRYQGTRDPLEGADVVGELVWSHFLGLANSSDEESLDRSGNGPKFLETKGSARQQLKMIPW